VGYWWLAHCTTTYVRCGAANFSISISSAGKKKLHSHSSSPERQRHVRRVGVQGRPCPARGESGPGRGGVVSGRRRRAAQGAGARPQWRGGDVVRGTGAPASGAGVGAVRGRSVPAALPPALHRPPHLRAPGLCQVQAPPHVRHRRQDPQRL
jgi:hypothetical protein